MCVIILTDVKYGHRKENISTAILGKGKGKGKAVPLQAWTGPEGSRKSRLPDFKTIGT
jgi:hypothetical protein